MFDFPAKAVLLFIFQYFYQDRTTDTFSRIRGDVVSHVNASHTFCSYLFLIWCCETLSHYSRCTPVYMHTVIVLQNPSISNETNSQYLIEPGGFYSDLKKKVFWFSLRSMKQFFFFLIRGSNVSCQLPTGVTRFLQGSDGNLESCKLTRMILDMILHLLH